MTSEEIQEKQAIDLSTNSWLREMCLQLALLNEKQAKVANDRKRPNH